MIEEHFEKVAPSACIENPLVIVPIEAPTFENSDNGFRII